MLGKREVWRSRGKEWWGRKDLSEVVGSSQQLLCSLLYLSSCSALPFALFSSDFPFL
jgi:hypothetical protein